jgi:hypothetical protein
MSECQLLKTEYQTLKNLQEEFEVELANAIKSGKTEKVQTLKKVITEKLQNLKKKLYYPKKITAKFSNPETTKTENKDKDIEINVEEEIQKQQEFYAGKEGMPNFNKQEVRQIFRKYEKEIQKAIEAYGYDTITIIPAKLPDTEALNQIMTSGYKNKTFQSSDFKRGGGFNKVTSIESQKTRVILTHSDQDIYVIFSANKEDNANPFLKATLNQLIDQLSAKAIEGLSLNEYLIIQRQYFENTGGHLDEMGWTWLPKSHSASHVVFVGWKSDKLCVNVHYASHRALDLACRLCEIFELP